MEFRTSVERRQDENHHFRNQHQQQLPQRPDRAELSGIYVHDKSTSFKRPEAEQNNSNSRSA